jgi:threonine dehydratase
MLRLIELEKTVVEGGGATGLAALLQNELPELKVRQCGVSSGTVQSTSRDVLLLQGKRVVVPLCGGNVDTPVLGRVLERGLAADGRLMRFEAVTSDRPGGINALTTVIARVGGT